MRKLGVFQMASGLLATSLNQSRQTRCLPFHVTSPFFIPSRSMRVKNKLRRKWYK